MLTWQPLKTRTLSSQGTYLSKRLTRFRKVLMRMIEYFVWRLHFKQCLTCLLKPCPLAVSAGCPLAAGDLQMQEKL